MRLATVSLGCGAVADPLPHHHRNSGSKGVRIILAGMLLLCAPGAYSQPLTFTTVAGYAGQGSADGIGSNAGFYNPSGVAVDASGNVYVADT